MLIYKSGKVSGKIWKELQNTKVERKSVKKMWKAINYRTRAIISGCSKISMAQKFSKISMPKTLKPYFLDIIVDTKA